jgi:hypothetical protein
MSPAVKHVFRPHTDFDFGSDSAVVIEGFEDLVG